MELTIVLVCPSPSFVVHNHQIRGGYKEGADNKGNFSLLLTNSHSEFLPHNQHFGQRMLIHRVLGLGGISLVSRPVIHPSLGM